MSAPASGEPVKQATLMMENTIPILTPIFFKSVVKLDSVAGNKLCTPAAKYPYTMTKAICPLRVVTAAQQYMSRPAKKDVGTRRLRGPQYLSARNAGIMRPGIPTPFRISRREMDVDGETCMISRPNGVT